MQAADLNVLLACQGWLRQGRKAVLLTVLRTWGSSPRPPGAMMAIRDDAVVSGSVSGGCIEDDLIDRVRQTGIASLCPGNRPAVAIYGIQAEEARRFGIPCGGTLQLVLEPLAAHSRIDDTVRILQQRQALRRDIDMRTGAATLGCASAEVPPQLQEEHFSYTLVRATGSSSSAPDSSRATCARSPQGWISTSPSATRAKSTGPTGTSRACTSLTTCPTTW